MSKTYASHSCVSRVKSPVHSRFATYPDVSCRIWTRIRGLGIPCPVLLDEWDVAAIGLEPIFQDPKSCVLQQQRSWCITHRPQVHRWIRTIPDGFADHSDHQILRTKMDSVRAPRTPADFQSAATTESAYCPFCRITPTSENRTRKIAWLKVMVPLAGIAVCVPQPGGLDSNQ